MATKKKDIYILCSCDAWKSYSSMNLICASTKIDDIIKAVKKGIKSGDIVYSDESLLSQKQLIKFQEDLEKNDDVLYTISSCDYCFLSIVKEGEIQ